MEYLTAISLCNGGSIAVRSLIHSQNFAGRFYLQPTDKYLVHDIWMGIPNKIVRYLMEVSGESLSHFIRALILNRIDSGLKSRPCRSLSILSRATFRKLQSSSTLTLTTDLGQCYTVVDGSSPLPTYFHIPHKFHQHCSINVRENRLHILLIWPNSLNLMSE